MTSERAVGSGEAANDRKAPSPSLFECADLTAGYGDLEIVHGFSMRCETTEIVGVIGPNGCGKSTLMKRLAGLLQARSGRISFRGRDLTSYHAGQLARAGLHYVPQERDIFPSLTVRENLLLGEVSPALLDVAIDTVNPELRKLLHRKAGRLSGGERKSLGVARALMKPHLDVLLLDEPSAGLSPVASARLWPVIAQVAERGVAVVVVEQRVEEFLPIAGRVYVMVDGQNRMEEEAPVLLANLDKLAGVFMGA